MLMGILGHVTDDDESGSIVKRLLDALASGSYLVLCDGTDTNPAGVAARRVTPDADDRAAVGGEAGDRVELPAGDIDAEVGQHAVEPAHAA